MHGSLLEQAEKTLDLVYFKYLKAKIWYENGEQRVEKFPFPREGLRELIFNALVHKDYGSGVPIQISVYADKLYVANVGSLPETWTVETLRNICETLHYYDYGATELETVYMNHAYEDAYLLTS